MGMYTEMFVTGSIPVTDENSFVVRGILEGTGGYVTPDHEFFKCTRVWAIGNCTSYYFQPRIAREIWVDEISGRLHFISLSNLKDYDDEIRKFFDWLSTTSAEYFGYSRYEETPLKITHYHSKNDERNS